MTDEDGHETSSLRAVAHPLRLRMLSLLTGTAMSAAEVARELEVTHANASYHLRTLAEAGYVVVDGEEKIRGGVAKRYRYVDEREHHESPSTEDEIAYLHASTRELERRYHRRRDWIWSSDLEGWVEPEVFDEAMRLLRQASALLHGANRPPRTPGTVPVSATSIAFRLEETP
ncbi:winged helix-turn-helix domain-containing protein [Nocardioides bruguierae]|uniref:winged helix-turn-helix domain-containing protein n=1 Tax=Nocardioides bruguierae TaxID=2945102 RepID=UPI002021B81C|nr:helix-turn-helix domain-containing protein [Nocardioides bruguierae]MCL8025612.1 helix-turn-helix domain-containing protein [Nocardioides bruguierae]